MSAVKAKLSVAVDHAFRQAGDLKLLVTFSSKTPTSFNWTTLQANGSETVLDPVEALLYERVLEGASVWKGKLLVRKTDFPGSLYDTASASGTTYRIVSLEDFDFFVVLSVEWLE